MDWQDQGIVLAIRMHGESSAIGFNQCTCQRQTKACAGGLLGCGQLTEGLQRHLDFFIIHANARIFDADDGIARIGQSGGHNHLPARLIEFHSIR